MTVSKMKQLDPGIIEQAILDYVEIAQGGREIQDTKRVISEALDCNRDIVESGIRKLIDLQKIKFGSHFEIRKSDNVAA